MNPGKLLQLAGQGSQDPDAWRTPQFRQKMIKNIEEVAMLPGGVPIKSPSDLENQVFQKAKSKEEYLSLITKLIIYYNDQYTKKMGGGQMPVSSGMQMGGAGGGSHMQGPGMTSQSGAQGGMMQDPLHALTNLTKGPGPNMPAGQGQMPPGGPGNMMPPGVHPGGMGPPFNTYQQINTGPMGQQGMPRGMGPAANMQSGRADFMMPGPQGNVPMNQQTPGIVGPQGQISSSQGMGQNSSMSVSQPPAHSPVMLPSPNAGLMGVASSPMSRPGQLSGAPSPSSTVNLNTPGNNPASVGSAMSPAARNPEEEKVYLEKLKHLQKYVEPLRRMIARIEKEEERKKDWLKMKNLLEILTDSSKRLPIETLSKCQQVLEKLDWENHPKPDVSLPKAHMSLCQNLLDKLAAHAKNPMFNHTLKRTFGPALEALHGTPIKPPTPPPKKARSESPPRSVVSPVLEGEIARLNRRFFVDLDPLHHIDSKNVHLVCKLEDKNLPSVPPISITVPSNYPSASPTCDTEMVLYEGTPFLQKVQKSLSSHLLNMPSRFSLTALLNMWEMSVRKATVATSVPLKA